MKKRNRRSVLQSARADGDGMIKPPGHLITGAGRKEVLRKGGGEEARSVRCMYANAFHLSIVLRREHEMLFRVQPGSIWVDLAMSNTRAELD